MVGRRIGGFRGGTGTETEPPAAGDGYGTPRDGAGTYRGWEVLLERSSEGCTHPQATYPPTGSGRNKSVVSCSQFPLVGTMRPPRNGIALGPAILRPEPDEPVVGSSERVNASRTPVCPRPLQTSMPNGVPAAIRKCHSPVDAALDGRDDTADRHSLGWPPRTSCAATASP